MHRLLTPTISTLLLSGLLVACGPGGEDSLTVTGTLTQEARVEPAAQVTMVWHHDALDGDVTLGERVDVTGEFPTAFELELVGPPAGLPAGAVVTIGHIVALAPETSEMPELDAVLGIAEEHVVVYLTDVVDDPVFGGELGAGYHLMEVIAATEGFDAMTELPPSSAVHVRMAPAGELRVPEVF